MYMDNLRNPIVIGILAAIVTYIALYAKRHYYDTQKGEQVSIIPPILIGLLAWFISGKCVNYCYDPGYDVTDVIGLNEEMMLRNMADF